MLGIANVIVPPGWLPIGVRAAAQGRLGLALWGVLGFMALAAASLGRAYRTTIRLYTRGGGTRRRRATGTSRSPKIAGRSGTRFIERTIPGCSEPAAALALAGLRSFLRSPQSKMLLLTPVVFLFLAGAMFAGERREVSPEIAPLLALAVVGLTMFFLAHNFQNAFGFDRDGFRAIVLSGVPRRQILLGKNLALAPLALALGGAGLTVLQFIAPMGLTHLCGAVLLLITGYLLCCVLGNVVSVLAPIGISSRTLKPVQPKLTTVIKQVLFFLLFPVVMTPIMIPYAVELGLETLGWRHGVPVFLLLSAVTLALTVWLYRWILGPEGRLLHYLEQHVLDVVTRTVD